MSELRPVEPVKLFCGVLARSEAMLERAREGLAARIGPVELTSEGIPFDFTDYYAAEMGEGLWRWFVAFAGRGAPGDLPEVKREALALEVELARREGDRIRRRVNLDPGYITTGKLVLASTKNAGHRLYLGQGILGEVTCTFSRNGLIPFPWTFPDFRSGRYDPFFLELRRRLQAESKSS